jgi:hypothetical protein
MSESLEIIGHISQIRPSDVLFEFRKDNSVAVGSIKIEDIKVCHFHSFFPTCHVITIANVPLLALVGKMMLNFFW